MPESQSDEREKALQAVRDGYESEVRARRDAAKEREDRNIELLDQISKQLESIEQLLRERLVTKT